MGLARAGKSWQLAALSTLLWSRERDEEVRNRVWGLQRVAVGKKQLASSREFFGFLLTCRPSKHLGPGCDEKTDEREEPTRSV
jgi:hypothetical protein